MEINSNNGQFGNYKNPINKQTKAAIKKDDSQSFDLPKVDLNRDNSVKEKVVTKKPEADPPKESGSFRKWWNNTIGKWIPIYYIMSDSEYQDWKKKQGIRYGDNIGITR